MMFCIVLGLTTMRPSCNQLYNIFYSSHPSAMRVEPLLHPGFKHIMPVKIPQYEKFPYGDSAPLYASMCSPSYHNLTKVHLSVDRIGAKKVKGCK